MLSSMDTQAEKSQPPKRLQIRERNLAWSVAGIRQCSGSCSAGRGAGHWPFVAASCGLCSQRGWTLWEAKSILSACPCKQNRKDPIPTELLSGSCLSHGTACEGQADPQPCLDLRRMLGPGVLASMGCFILNLLFSLFFTGLSKDSSPNPVRDDAFLLMQCVGQVFSGGQGVVSCGW